MVEPSATERGPSADADAPPRAAIARSEQTIMRLGWPYVAVPDARRGWLRTWPQLAPGQDADHPLARRIISCFGLVLGGSAGMVIGGLGAGLLAAVLFPFVPHLVGLLVLSVTLFSVAFGAIVGQRVLQRETFE